MASQYLDLPVESGGGGITSINGDTTAAQIITGQQNISAITSGGTTTIGVSGLANSQLLVTDASANLVSYAGWGTTVVGTTTATITFNSQHSTIQLTLTGGDTCVLTIAGVVTGGAYVIKVLNAAGASVTWPGSFDWGTAGAPTLSGAGAYDDVHLLVQQSTANIHAYISQGFSS